MIKRLLTGFVVAVLVVSWAHASQAELQEAYGAYQEAAATGNVRAALPHAQRAYELGLELYGPDSRNTGLLAFNYGSALNEILEFETALPVISVGLDALQASGGEQSTEYFDLTTEEARIYLSLRNRDEAIRSGELALELAQSLFGDESVEAAWAHLNLAMIPLYAEAADGDYFSAATGVTINRSDPEQIAEATRRPATRWVDAPDADRTDYLLGIRTLHLDPAERIFGAGHGDARGAAIAELVAANYDLDMGETDIDSDTTLEALTALNALRFADQFTVQLSVDWLNGPLRYRWSEEQIEQNWLAAIEHAYYRREGEPVAMVRIVPTYPVRAAQFSVEGMVGLEFTVNAEGRVEDVEVYDSQPRRTFDRAGIEAIEGFIYAPRMEGGVPVSQPGVKNAFQFTMDE